MFAGALLTNLIAFVHRRRLRRHAVRERASDHVRRRCGAGLEPIAGAAAATLFAFGLLGASLLGLGVVPMTSAYTTCEAFGWETGVDWNWREAPAFYGLLRSSSGSLRCSS